MHHQQYEMTMEIISLLITVLVVFVPVHSLQVVKMQILYMETISLYEDSLKCYFIVYLGSLDL